MLKIIFGRARSGKTYTLKNCLTETLRTGNSDVVLIVPEQYSFQSERDILEEIDSEYISRVKTLSFTRLLDEVGRECGGLAGKRINSGIRTIMVSRAIETVAQDLIAFAKQSGNINFASTMAGTIVEFKQAGISADILEETSAVMADSRLKWKLHDIALIMSAYDTLISRLFIDPADDMNRLAGMLDRNDWFAGKEIFIDCFKGFTRGEILVLEQIIRTAANVTITLPCDGTEDEEDGAGLFSNIKKTANDLLKRAKQYGVETECVDLSESFYDNRELRMLEKHLYSNEQYEFDQPTDRINICKADYPADEINFVARTIKRLVREEGYRFRDFVIIARDASAYDQLVARAMDSYGVPCHVDSRASAANQAVMVFALSSIDAAFNFNTESIIRWLKTGLAGYDDRQIAELENYTFIWNIRGKDWKTPWTNSPYGLDSRQPKDAADRLEKLESMRRDIVSRLFAFASSFGFGALGMAKAVYRFAVENRLPERLAEAYDNLAKKDKNAAEVLRQSYSVFMDILSDIAECYGDANISRDTFVSAFKVALTEYEIGTIPMGIDQVVFGSAGHIRTGRPRVAFLLGVNQDVFPATPRGEGLISVRERKTLIEMEIPVSDRLIDAAVDEKYMFYSAACCASERVYFVYSQANLSSEKMEPAPCLERVENIFKGLCKFTEGSSDIRNIEHIESMRSAKDTFAEIHSEDSPFAASVREYFGSMDENPVADYGAERSGFLSADTAAKLFGKDVYLSASKVDKFYGCPFSYFCKYGLNAKKITKAEMTALERGSTVHYIMEQILKEHGKKISLLSDAELTDCIERYTADFLKEINAEGIDDYRWNTMVRQVKDLAKVLCAEMGKQLADSDFEPVGFEVTLEAEGDIKPVVLELEDGGRVILGGQVDRVDAWQNGEEKYVCVVDYKTGRKKFHLPDLLYGLNMQMMLYLYSALKRDNGKFAENNPAGILYIPSERNIEEADGKPSHKTEAYSGILIHDYDVLAALDKTKSGRYIPIKYKTNGELYADSEKLVLSKDEFELLFKNAEDKLVEMGKRLHLGDIEISPMDGADSSADACKYCDYRAVCRREKTQKNNKVEKKLLKADVLNILRGETDGEEATD